MITRHSLALAASIAVLATASTHAATITWSAATNISGDADVSTAGTLVVAHDLSVADSSSFTANLSFNLAPTDPVVNGVTFTPFIVIPSSASAVLGNVTLSAPTPILNGENLVGSPATPFSALSADYQTLLRSYVGAGGVPVTLTLSGLTVGATYAFQWWVSASDRAYSDGARATAGNTVTLDLNVGDVVGGTGQFAIGTFIADNASQDIVFENTDNGEAVLNAFQLRQISQLIPPGTAVPEPGSALVGMLVLGLCSARLGRRRS